MQQSRSAPPSEKVDRRHGGHVDVTTTGRLVQCVGSKTMPPPSMCFLKNTFLYTVMNHNQPTTTKRTSTTIAGDATPSPRTRRWRCEVVLRYDRATEISTAAFTAAATLWAAGTLSRCSRWVGLGLVVRIDLRDMDDDFDDPSKRPVPSGSALRLPSRRLCQHQQQPLLVVISIVSGGD
jgi:hypothetical protein